jgi:hypothetical protein
MFLSILAGVFVLLGLLLLYSGLRMLVRKGWILAWMRGMFGLVLLGASGLLALAAADLLTYRQMVKDKPVGTVSFIKTGQQSFTANVLLAGATEEQSYALKGDQWQIDARIIRWKGLFSNMGAKPGYRLDRLSGRYYSLADERSAERTVYALTSTGYGPDVWEWVHEQGDAMPWISAIYGSATFVPMKDGALYEITLTSSGLAARALNDVARGAMHQWD